MHKNTVNKNKDKSNQDFDSSYNPNIDVTLYVLNEKNKYITKKAIENILTRYNITHKVKNLACFQTAMTPSSYTINSPDNVRLVKLIKEKNLQPIPNKSLGIPLREVSYQRLEFLGDSVIHIILAKYLYDRYPNEQEGFMTRLRTKIESGEALAEFTRAMGLQEYILMPRNLEEIGGRENNYKILEDAFEAFIGSLFLESSLETCTQLVIGLLEKEVDIPSLIHNETNYKDTLLQYYHRMRWPDPEYGSSGAIDKNNKKIFCMHVKGYNTNTKGEREWGITGNGSGKSKKSGEQAAAKASLIKFGVIKNDEDEQAEYEEIYEEGSNVYN
jgi:dsRNA-specific ribonuclease